MTVSEINVYPIKSCKGFGVTSAKLDEYGLVGDRRMMIVDSNGTALTQRDLHQMGFIEPSVIHEILTLRAPGMQDLVVPFDVFSDNQVAVDVWDDSCIALDCGNTVAEWVADYLHTTCRLVRMDQNFQRPIDKNYSTRDEHVSFADGFPLLLISEASLEDLNSRLDVRITMNRFRPSIVVKGCDAFAEDAWKTIRIGELLFEVVKPCARCVVTTIDPNTGRSGHEPLKTLATYRRTNDGKIMFGQNVIHIKKSGTLTLGAEISVVNWIHDIRLEK
ncbi:MOSC domain-containing protein [bacterium]|nr:MOSC domain-containing protein [bacterium]